jgi:hypothetical protein
MCLMIQIQTEMLHFLACVMSLSYDMVLSIMRQDANHEKERDLDIWTALYAASPHPRLFVVLHRYLAQTPNNYVGVALLGMNQ